MSSKNQFFSFLSAPFIFPSSGTSSSTGPWRDSSTPLLPSTSHLSLATSPLHPPSWETRCSGSRPELLCCPATTSKRCSRRPAYPLVSSTSSWETRRRSPTSSSPTRTLPASISPDPPPCSRACGRRWGRTSGATRAIQGSSGRPVERISSSPIPRRTPTRWRRPSSGARSNTRGRSAAPPRG